MAKVSITFLTTTTDLPAGVREGLLHVSLQNSVGETLHEQDVSGVSAIFENVAEADYTLAVVRHDTEGKDIGAPFYQNVTVSLNQPVGTYQAPTGMKVSVEPDTAPPAGPATTPTPQPAQDLIQVPTTSLPEIKL